MTQKVPILVSSAAPHRRSRAAFTLLETMVATALCALAISAFYLSTNHAVRLARAGRETALASEVLEQRLSAIRRLPLWTSVTSISGITQLLSTPSPAAASFPPASETITVETYPPGGGYFTVSRSATGSFTITDRALPSAPPCVQVTAQIGWMGPNNLAANRQLSTILTKGGL